MIKFLRSPKFWLVAILLLAAFLRLYRYDFHDAINDEVFYGFRSIGLIDSLNSPYQPTPWEWLDPNVPAWARLSFHDHPPLGFYIQHLFFKIFGNDLLGLRLPAIVAGVISVYLLYRISELTFANFKVSLLAAGILAVNSYHVWISRIAMQESFVIFFILLAIFLFLKTLTLSHSPPPEGKGEMKEGVYFYLTAVATGLAILTKYTSLILLPIFLTYLLWKRRDLLNWRRLMLSAVLLLVILSPVIIYNLKLYASRGHFDFQVSYLLKQSVPQWQLRPGREVGTWAQKFQNLFKNYWQYAGPVFSALTLIAIFGLFKNLRKKESLQFLGLVILFLVILILVIGPQERFLVMLVPFVSLLVALSWRGEGAPPAQGGRRGEVVKMTKFAILGILLLLELAYLVNTYYAVNPRGQLIWQYSRLRYDHNLWGYNQLEDYLQEKMRGVYPEQVFKLKYEFANTFQDQAIKRAQKAGREAKPILFITDTSMHGLATLWYVHRHVVYDGWPMINSLLYQDWLANDPNYFRNHGFKEFVFIKAHETLLRQDEEGKEAKELERKLLEQGNLPILIKSPGRGKIAFKIYEF